MCIYYHTESDQLIAWSEDMDAWIPLEDWAKMSEHFPGTPGAVLTDREPGQRKIEVGHWGLTPAWADKPTFGKQNAVNARSETLDSKPTFRDPFRLRRCIVPMSGFFERGEDRWVEFRLRSGQMLMVAGLFEEPNRHSSTLTYTIATVDSNAAVYDLNDRMPVIFDIQEARLWLDSRTPAEKLLGQLKASPADDLMQSDGGEVRTPTKKKRDNPNDQGTLF